jgi:DNA-binding transcriptional ArsR family regulator
MNVQSLAEVLAALGNEKRLEIVAAILRGKKLSCGEIAQKLGLSRPALSHHLKTLEEAGLIVRTYQGRERCPRLTQLLGECLRPEVVRMLREEENDGT